MLRNLCESIVVAVAVIALTVHGCDCFRQGQQTFIDSGKQVGQQHGRILPALPKEITPPQVKDLLDRYVGYIYLDVRTEAEFAEGHVPGALNIPVMLKDPQTSRMMLNGEFLSTVEQSIRKDARLIVGCRSGVRSTRAQEILQPAGYDHVANMLGGFIGQRNEAGEVIHPGWSMMGYPVERGDSGDGGLAD